MAVASLINLASTFDSVIKTFEHIHFTENFGLHYDDCMLKLANVNLRLSRWGEAVGLSSVDEYTRSIYSTKVVEEHIPQAINLLGAIQAALETAKDRDREYNADDPSILKAKKELSYADLSLHEVHRRIIRKRRNHLSVVEKATWVLRDRERFKVMIDDIADKTRELENLFPAAQNQEKAIMEEAREFSESLRVLRKVISKQDGALASALDSILEPLEEKIDSTVYGRNVYGGVVGVMAGQGGTFTQHDAKGNIITMDIQSTKRGTFTQHVGRGIVTTVHGGIVGVMAAQGGTFTRHVGKGIVNTVHGSNVGIQSTKGGTTTQH
ncbi:unnamed protein product [Clonostachys rhizophaga]|uniref:Prion-inhibition and propagation HeLo domain-containing protein n=1 Tax=Clonostachys rhizophaga TaxID=160324 RepID=A0A9N9VZ98_9HYPO|nr:unnamed protein product [Clonostachys rhizophaga]